MQFQGLHGTLDNVFRKLHENGIGAKVKHAEVITKDEENQLWDSGVIGIDSPTSLQNAVFYYNGKNFCLRGGEECRQLMILRTRFNLLDFVRAALTSSIRKHHTRA